MLSPGNEKIILPWKTLKKVLNMNIKLIFLKKRKKTKTNNFFLNARKCFFVLQLGNNGAIKSFGGYNS